MKEKKIPAKVASCVSEGHLGVCRGCGSGKRARKLFAWLEEKLGPEDFAVDTVGCMHQCPGRKKVLVALGGTDKALRLDPKKERKELLKLLRKKR